MSEESDSNTDKELAIYIPLMNEGVPVSRPTQAKVLQPGRYEVLATEDYDSSLEEWQFPPGSIVECRVETFDGQEILQAFRRIG